jgi:hypothetical protein
MDNEYNFEEADDLAESIQEMTDFTDLSKRIHSKKDQKLLDFLTSPDMIDGKLSSKQLAKDEKKTGEAWQRIENRLYPNKHIRGQRWKYIAAAASVCLLVGFSTFYFTSKHYNKMYISTLSDGNKAAGTVGKTNVLPDVIDLERPQDVIHLRNDIPVHAYRKDIADYSLINMGLGKERVIYNRIEVPRGGEFKFRLSDGTVVHLNAGSSLKFPVNFISTTREVELTGEAYFEVSPANKPFIVNTNYGDVRVLGTKFNVKAYPKDYFMEVSLLEGSVQLLTYGNAPVTLDPSQHVYFDENTRKLTVKTGDAAINAAWKDGKIIFKDRELEYIMTNLARWYDMKVLIESDVLKKMRFGCKLNKFKTIEPIFELLESTGKIKVEVKGNQVCLKETR